MLAPCLGCLEHQHTASAMRASRPPVPPSSGLLEGHDGVGAGGNGRAGHDADGRARLHAQIGDVAGGQVVDDLELHRMVHGWRAAVSPARTA